MKKSLVALAILAAAGVASAQSSVTLFGVMDVAYQQGSGSLSNRTQLTSGGNSTSRLGFRGTEDLGRGMSASFWLEAQLDADTGASLPTNTNNQTTGATAGAGLTFMRRSTLSLARVGMGELRLGRDVTPHFWNHAVFDPFGPGNMASSQTFGGATWLAGPTGVRGSNGISYFLPGNLGGFYGQAMHYRGENPTGLTPPAAWIDSDGNGSAIRLGYANGPINVAVATSNTLFAKTATTGDIASTNLGASYNLGVATVMGLWTRDTVGRLVVVTGNGTLIGVSVPMQKVGQIRASYSTYKTDAGLKPTINKMALGYVHDLSRRTALYGALVRVSNSGGASQALSGATTAANGSSTGYNVGIRHNF